MSKFQPQTSSGNFRGSMARPYICVLILAAVLLLDFPTVSGSKGLWGKEHRRASRIPSEFSQEERVTMKEALKGETGSPLLTCAHIWVPFPLGQTVIPLSHRRESATLTRAPQHTPAQPLSLPTSPPAAPRAQAWECHASLSLASGDCVVPCLASHSGSRPKTYSPPFPSPHSLRLRFPLETILA